MISARSLAISISWAMLSVPFIYVQDLSRYREFQFGANPPAIAKQVGLEPSEAKVIHQRPALIQELEWQAWLSLSSLSQANPVRTVLFSFYNGELFRIAVNYDHHMTEGLTEEDMVEAISAKYGTATRPRAKIATSSFRAYNDSEKVIARWEDAQYSFNIFRSSYEPTFGMIGFSKRLDALAQAATIEAMPLDEQEAPQREIERQRKEAEENRVEQAKARLASKATFRP